MSFGTIIIKSSFQNDITFLQMIKGNITVQGITVDDIRIEKNIDALYYRPFPLEKILVDWWTDRKEEEEGIFLNRNSSLIITFDQI